MDRILYLKELKAFGIANDIPNISEDNAEYLRSIIRENDIKNMLEIGTANGYSTIHFADELQKLGGHIDTIEFSPLSYELATKNFEATGVSSYITQYLGNALDILPTLGGPYDFVFIDGMKKRSLDFLLLIWEKVPQGGIIIIDDVIKFRYKMESLYKYLEEKNIPYTLKKIDEDDGIMILKK